MKIINRKKYLDKVLEATNIIKEIVGSTMTVNGKYVSLIDGTTTNDGVTIINSLDFSDPIMQDVLSKLQQAANQTDNNAGDGTSATTIMTSALVEALHNSQDLTIREVEEKINDILVFVNIAITELKKDLKTEKDFVDLATLSTKDKTMGELIGKAFHKGGKTSMVQIRDKNIGNEDSVETENAFIFMSTNVGSGLPTDMTDVKTILIDGPVNNDSDGLNKLLSYASENKFNLLIVARSTGDIAERHIKTFNQMNGTNISLLDAPTPNNYITYEDIIGDTSAAMGGVDWYSLESIENSLDDSMFGSVDNVKIQQDGTFIMTEKKSDKTLAHIEKLKEKLDEIKDAPNKQAVNILTQRINMLTGTTIYFNLYAATREEFTTKHLRVEDAVKAIQYTMNDGIVPGAGKVFERAADLMVKSKKENEFTDSLLSVRNKVWEIGGKNNEDTQIDKVFDVVSQELVDPFEKGIIDSVKVTLNVILNSTSIVKNISKINFKLLDDEEVQN